MRLLVLTSNAIRHQFIANTLAEAAEEALVVCECRPSDAAGPAAGSASLAAHFRLRYGTECRWFAGHDGFRARTLPVLYGEANLPSTVQIVTDFRPDVCVVFGASLITDPLLSLLPAGRTVNLHLGLSPYYRGSGTNFWPFVNEELEYVGSTLLHLDAGIDTGAIIAHIVPAIEPGDTVHTVGCKVIRASAEGLLHVLRLVRDGQTVPHVPQWRVADGRYYRSQDVTEEILARYHRNLDQGLVDRFLRGHRKSVKVIRFPEADQALPAAPAKKQLLTP